MDLRITNQTMVERALENMRTHTDRLGILQEQASSGNRLLSPSDDPVATVAVMMNTAQDLRLDTYLSNIQAARSDLNISNSALVEAGNILSQAQSIAVEASNSANDTTSFEALAQQVDGLLGRLLDQANTKNGDQYLFGGTASEKAPFSIASTDSQGRPQSIVYQGSQGRGVADVGQQQTAATLYPGSQIFQARSRGLTVFTTNTGAAAGTGTDSATGQGSLLVRHTSTTFAPGSGVQAGTSSTNGDTILGPAGANNLTIVDTSGNGTSGTISLNGGPPVAFTNTDTDLKVTGLKGEVVYLNTTAITPNFNGNVALTANGTLSVDGGASSIAIDFTSANQVVTNSQTGAITNVDSRNIRLAGTATLNYSGTYDAFQALMALRDDLRNTRGLTTTQQIQSITGRIAELQRVRTGVLQGVGEQSTTLQNLDALESRTQSVQLTTRELTGNLQGADITQVVTGIAQEQNLLQLTLATTGRIFSQSLLDFLK